MIGLLLLAVVQAAPPAPGRTVLYEERVTQLGPGLAGVQDLWLTTKELTQATGFELKPEGVCREELCFPVPKARTQEFLKKGTDATWFNLSAFGRMLKQAEARDEPLGVFVFGPRPDQRDAHLQSLQAPDFTLPDKDGRPQSLRDLRGKKVLLVTWASW
jgi:hypothetical protein